MKIKEILSTIEKERSRNENSENFNHILSMRKIYTEQKVIDESHELIELGLEAFQNNLHTVAKNHYQKSIEIFPTCNAYFLLAMVEYENAEFYQALRWSIAAAMFVNYREFNYWNAFLLRNVCVLYLLIESNDNWEDFQLELAHIFQEYILPNFVEYESKRREYGLYELFSTSLEVGNIKKSDLTKILPPKDWVYSFSYDNKNDLQ